MAQYAGHFPLAFSTLISSCLLLLCLFSMLFAFAQLLVYSLFSMGKLITAISPPHMFYICRLMCSNVSMALSKLTVSYMRNFSQAHLACPYHF